MARGRESLEARGTLPPNEEPLIELGNRLPAEVAGELFLVLIRWSVRSVRDGKIPFKVLVASVFNGETLRYARTLPCPIIAEAMHLFMELDPTERLLGRQVMEAEADKILALISRPELPSP